MKRSLCWMAVGWVALLLGCSGESPSAQDELREEIERRLDAAAADGFSGTAVVTVGGVAVLARGYGLADRESGVPNGVDTAYDAGSMMKSLTAVAIFKLEAEGKLALADSLATIFDDVPADKAAITVLDVVQHRAGFREYHDTQGDFEPMTRPQARQRIFAQPLLFEPGSEAAYSNSGYTLLADIVETVSGRAFTDYIHEELMAPAGMRDSGFYSEPVWERVDTAIGYDAATFGTNDPAEWPYTWALVGNGGLVTTAADLERWLVAVRGGKVLSPSAWEAYQAQVLAPESQMLEGKVVYGYAGAGDFGFGGLAVECPEVAMRVVIATNTYDVFDIESFGVELSELVLSAE